MTDWQCQSAMDICALCYIYMKLIWCHGFAEIYVQLGGSSALVVLHCAIYETYLV